MPIEIQHDGDDPIDVRPGTNEARVLAVLSKYPNTAFTKTELAEHADVKQTSVYKTVDRLVEKGVIERHSDGDHVHINHDRRDAIYRRLRSFKDANTLERMFDDDYFEENPNWASDLPDLGQERLPQPNVDAEQGDHEADLETIAEMPDLDE
ncbi:MarR family transcriptional regulator [Saliphagus infecundisoli]|uniref:MarR family transcriptional regulator n=1 Tax=Saliphagus infecundisoli TaxID=1849069 RepID=A0ABD5QAK6_9EURY|nr:MarR family transcriptional regulator [Saliphagus infecundisoli]